MSRSPPSPFFERMLNRRGLLALALLALTAVLGTFASRVRPDFSIEMAFPTFDRSRIDYERYKRDFPLDDAGGGGGRGRRSVHAGRSASRGGTGRWAVAHPGVVDTQGPEHDPGSVAGRRCPAHGKLFPKPISARMSSRVAKQTALTDPLFAWNLAPDGRATIIRVTLTREQGAQR